MPDGVRLSVIYFKPVSEGETFPALLEMLPYRKDDMFYLRDYPLGVYFARHGYVVARVDVRGTGSSEGALPAREYSDAEIDDAEELIDQLSKAPWCNGNVGMYGISWSGFNAIHAAMRKPPALKAILSVDASDDLFHDDVYVAGSRGPGESAPIKAAQQYRYLGGGAFIVIFLGVATFRLGHLNTRQFRLQRQDALGGCLGVIVVDAPQKVSRIRRAL